MATNEMTEEQAVHLVRNALLVAGHEMGTKGDHWPVIKSTVYSVMKNHEEFKIERNVFDEVKKHFENMMVELEGLRNESPAEAKAEIEATLVELKEIYTASFTPIRTSDLHVDEEEFPSYIKRALVITETLEDSGHD